MESGFSTQGAVPETVRVAQQVATMDHLPNGRHEFETGRGSSTTEMATSA